MQIKRRALCAGALLLLLLLLLLAAAAAETTSGPPRARDRIAASPASVSRHVLLEKQRGSHVRQKGGLARGGAPGAHSCQLGLRAKLAQRRPCGEQAAALDAHATAPFLLQKIFERQPSKKAWKKNESGRMLGGAHGQASNVLICAAAGAVGGRGR